jgi:hypothetical protein
MKKIVRGKMSPELAHDISNIDKSYPFVII